MKNTWFVLCFTSSLLLTSCFNDADDNLTIEGVWRLTAMNVEDGFDINEDGVANVNLLNEIDCVNNETLVFESKGVVTSNKTFNPDIKIALLEGTTDAYVFDVECDVEGTINFAVNYTQNNNLIIINESEAILNGNQLTRVFENAINIYSEDFINVIATKKVTLVYTKQ
ncbi:hypothetical protein ACFSKN_00235 [Mariniflexile gromovii]|uniref:Lipocalin-like protein n=1 Tax=Mariniflexile gromovii TaxID=362523 RepID=A0ABS4BRU3_9FLAO|nr:hypothetical protein [Mariniflexile gromovii]MBP0903301.1 hypothetical protein [Mariniflexile gromovii]